MKWKYVYILAPFNLTNFSFEILKLCWDTRYFHAYFSFIYYSNIAVAVGFFWNSGTPEQHFQCINTMTITERERDDFSQQHQEHFYYDAMYCLSGVKMALVTLLLLLCPVTCNGTCWASLTCCSIATDWGLKAPSGRKPTHSKDAKSDSSLLFYPKKCLPRRSKEFCKARDSSRPIFTALVHTRIRWCWHHFH